MNSQQNQTPSSERIHIGIFGKRNAGKSSVINAITGQELAIVSELKGTTTDPVSKSMELLPLGPVVVIDTPGLDDEGELGQKRIGKSYQVLNKTDIGVLVIDGTAGKDESTEHMIGRFEDKKIPYVIVYNKADLCGCPEEVKENEIWISAKTGFQVQELKEMIAGLKREDEPAFPIVADLLAPSDLVVLVVPIDKAAPKGRLILPQQQTIREVLDTGCMSLVVRDTELADALGWLSQPPRMVITDSQAFGRVAEAVPAGMLLTSFSILFARHKGNLEAMARGVAAMKKLKDGDKVLICEGCTHHRQCGDIGTEKLPRWISDYTKKKLDYRFCSGTEFPEDLTPYRLILHCGGCMLTEREMKYRIACAEDQGVPVTNYGIAIACVHGILKRSVEVFPDIEAILEE